LPADLDVLQIYVSLLPSHCAIDATTDVAVVIDVLRATSVIATALSAGADSVVTCREVTQAREYADSFSPRPLLCGERQCQPIDGFDLGNSPAEYTSERVLGRRLVLTTTNGTTAIEATQHAAKVVTASFLNLSSVVSSIADVGKVHLVCAGTDGHITIEDVLLAGALIDRCRSSYSAVATGDESVLASQLWQSWFDSQQMPGREALSARLRETRGGRNLVRQGYHADLDRCASIDSLQILPQRVSRDPVTFASTDSA
jgi:2-phosphosulfolactate phosphatase